MAASANPSAGDDDTNDVVAENPGPTTIRAHHNPGLLPWLRHNPGLSLDWSAEEQSILEELLRKYSSVPSVMRYCKIAQALNNKTVRDVALRCRWMTKKENGKRRKDDPSRKIKVKEEMVIDLVPKGANRSNDCTYAKSMVSTDNDDGIPHQDIGGAAAQLFKQTALALEQISANFAAFEINENVSLLSKARTFIHSSLTDCVSMDAEIMKSMPPLPELNIELLNIILSESHLLKSS